jgi:uncharacterized YigZ family protein
MDPANRYPVPARSHRTETVIERSRFITTLGPAGTPEAAKRFIAAVAAEFPDATHNCWAFVPGPPGDTSRIGMSDAGEPRGTAGRPMLNALLGSGVGDVAAVVTRYFGGVKLGTGGLSRAYGGCVKEALASLPLAERVERVEIALESSYPGAPELHRIIEKAGATVLEENYGADVRLRVSVPKDAEAEFRRSLGRLHGLARVLPDSRTGPA